MVAHLGLATAREVASSEKGHVTRKHSTARKPASQNKKPNKSA